MVTDAPHFEIQPICLFVRRIVAWMCCAIAWAALSCGCAITAKFWPPFERQVITATTQVNPDLNKRPSPVQVKILQLSERATFDNLTYDQIFFQGHVLLSDALLSESSFVLQPNEQVKHIEALNENVAFIAVVAAYRDIEHARWKHVYTVKPYSHKTTHLKLDNDGIAGVVAAYSKQHAHNVAASTAPSPASKHQAQPRVADGENTNKNNTENQKRGTNAIGIESTLSQPESIDSERSTKRSTNGLLPHSAPSEPSDIRLEHHLRSVDI
ncbi:MAG: type VI secretion system lipoprotein TssJ [Gammaproteobacteria bacterium]